MHSLTECDTLIEPSWSHPQVLTQECQFLEKFTWLMVWVMVSRCYMMLHMNAKLSLIRSIWSQQLHKHRAGYKRGYNQT